MGSRPNTGEQSTENGPPSQHTAFLLEGHEGIIIAAASGESATAFCLD
jgi:hypothetical protein